MAKTKTFPLIVGGVVIVAVGAAALLTREATLPFSGGGEERELLTALDGDSSQVAVIEIQEADVDIRLERDEDIWRLASKDGFPVQQDRVAALLERLDRLEGIRMVSDQPADFARYEVLEEDGGTRLRLLDANDELLAGMVLGSVVSDPDASGLIASYVRLERADEVWLMDGELSVQGEPLAWTGEDLLALDRSRIYEVRTAASEPEQRLVARRTEPTSQSFTAPELPEEVELEGPWILNDVIAPLERVVFEDVRAAEEPAEGDEVMTAEVSTVDGLRVSFDLQREEDGVWASMRVESSDRLISVEDDEGSGLDVSTNDLGDYLTPAEVDAEIEALRQRTEGWQFRLPDHVAERLTTTVEEAGERERAI